MDADDALVLVLFAGTLWCFWRAWWSGELHDAALTIRRRLEEGKPRPRRG
jgi:hypothetical protein